MSSSQFRYRPKIEKVGPLEWCWTTSFGVKPDKELCGLKPLYSSLNNLIFSFASSSERNQLTFKHSSRKLPLNDSMNGLSVGFPGTKRPDHRFVFDLRGSTQWAHRLAEKDFHYVRLFLDELREWAIKKTSAEPQGRPKLIKFLGDGFLFVWKISEDSVVTTSNAITASAYNLCVDYHAWVNEKEFIDRFP